MHRFHMILASSWHNDVKLAERSMGTSLIFEEGDIAGTMDERKSKPTLRDIRTQQYFDLNALAEKAGITLSIINCMLTDQPVHLYQAELVLIGLSELSGNEYTLDTVSVVLFTEKEERNS